MPPSGSSPDSLGTTGQTSMSHCNNMVAHFPLYWYEGLTAKIIMLGYGMVKLI